MKIDAMIHQITTVISEIRYECPVLKDDDVFKTCINRLEKVLTCLLAIRDAIDAHKIDTFYRLIDENF